MRVTVTANYDERTIRELLIFAARHVGLNHAGLRVKVKNSSSSFYGKAYHAAYTYADRKAGCKGLVTIGIGQPKHFPREPWRSAPQMNNWREALVFVAAHEFSHQVDFKADRKTSETTANRDGRTAVRAYRND